MAENVTITTFLELKDNLSAGLNKVLAALQKLESAQSGQSEAQKAQAKAQQEAAKAAEKIARRNAAFRKEAERFEKEQERKEKARQRAEAKSADFAARESRRRKVSAERLASSELSASQKAYATSVKASERAAKQQAAVELREQRRVEAARVRARKEQDRQRKAAAREQARAKRERADFVGKAGAAMFGKSAGGFMAAAMTSKAAAMQLGAIGLIDSLVTGIGFAISKAFDLTKGFIEKVFDLNKEYQISIRRVANSLTALNYAPTFDIAKGKAESLFNVLREKAAVLPGETKDYLEVFSMGLPMALAQGERDLDRFADKTSKYAAYALSRGITDVQHIARDYSRILQGRPIYTTRMYSELMPFLKMPAKDFNKLAPVERMKLFYKAIDTASTGFENMATDADAVLGTMNSMIDMILQKGGKPLFESSIAIIQRINDLLRDNNSVLTKTVELIGTRLGNVLEGAFSKVADIFTGMVDVNEQTLKAVGITGWWADSLLSALSVFRDLERAGEAARAQRKIDESAARREKEDAIRSTPAYKEAIKTAPGAKAFPTSAIGVSVTSGAGATAVSDAALAFKGTASMEQISKWALDKQKGAGRLGREAWTLAMRQQGLTDPEILALWQQKEAISMQPTTPAGGGRARTPRGAPPARQTTINDFRFSKFDIRQEFAEGFDPDRIAVAFASDLAKLGEMRMQSAYAPLFAQR